MNFKPGILFRCGMLGKHFEVWVLGNYFDFEMQQKSPSGQLTYQAKYSDDRTAAFRLADEVAKMVLAHFPNQSLFGRMDSVCAVPHFGAKNLSVPHVIASKVAEKSGVSDLSSMVSKPAPTAQMKTNPNPEVHPDQFRSAWTAQERHPLLVDDVYRSGATLASLISVLRSAGVEPVGAVCATRAISGMALQ